jgi:hypothetical protein
MHKKFKEGHIEMQRKYLQIIVFSFVFLVLIYYSFIFFTNQDTIKVTIHPAEEVINDFEKIGSIYQEAVRNTYQYFSLDSSSNLNPQSPLIRMDALKIIDVVASQKIKEYSASASSIPYFKDFNNNDIYANIIKRVCSYIDKVPAFPKHYEILGYELKKNEPITRLEFMMLISSFFGKGKQGSIYQDVPTEFASYISNLNALGIISSGNVLNANEPITREQAAIILYRTLLNLK